MTISAKQWEKIKGMLPKGSELICATVKEHKRHEHAKPKTLEVIYKFNGVKYRTHLGAAPHGGGWHK